MMTAHPVPAWQLSQELLSALDQRIVDTFFRIYEPMVTREGTRWVLTIPAHRNNGHAESWASGPAQTLAEFITALTRHKTHTPAEEAA
jgi:hypothetical protein